MTADGSFKQIYIQHVPPLSPLCKQKLSRFEILSRGVVGVVGGGGGGWCMLYTLTSGGSGCSVPGSSTSTVPVHKQILFYPLTLPKWFLLRVWSCCTVCRLPARTVSDFLIKSIANRSHSSRRICRYSYNTAKSRKKYFTQLKEPICQ
jgi:hypothetical protein